MWRKTRDANGRLYYYTVLPYVLFNILCTSMFKENGGNVKIAWIAHTYAFSGFHFNVDLLKSFNDTLDKNATLMEQV